MPPIDTISSIHQRAMTGRQIVSSPHELLHDLLKREPSLSGRELPIQSEEEHPVGSWTSEIAVVIQQSS